MLEYVGEVLDVQTWESRLKEYKAENRPLHCHVLNDHMVIDAGVKGNMARLINHSCEPNCTTIRWVVKGEDRIGIFALRDIAQGEEITIDYSWSPSEVGDQPCYCGAPSCTGYIGEKAFYDSARQGNQVGLARYSQKCLMVQGNAENSVVGKDDECFVCRLKGMLVCCDVPNCSKVYHRECLAADRAPDANAGTSVRAIAMRKVAACYMNGQMSTAYSAAIESHQISQFNREQEDEDAAEAAEQNAPSWRCPWHFCNECNETAVKGCAKCPTSFCHKHGNEEGVLEPFAVSKLGKRLEKVHTYKSASQQENQNVVDEAAQAGRCASSYRPPLCATGTQPSFLRQARRSDALQGVFAPRLRSRRRAHLGPRQGLSVVASDDPPRGEVEPCPEPPWAAARGFRCEPQSPMHGRRRCCADVLRVRSCRGIRQRLAGSVCKTSKTFRKAMRRSKMWSRTRPSRSLQRRRTSGISGLCRRPGKSCMAGARRVRPHQKRRQLQRRRVPRRAEAEAELGGAKGAHAAAVAGARRAAALLPRPRARRS